MNTEIVAKNLSNNANLEYGNWEYCFMRVDFTEKYPSYSGLCILENNYPDWLNLQDSKACDVLLDIAMDKKKNIEDSKSMTVTEIIFITNKKGLSDIRYSTLNSPIWKFEDYDEFNLQQFLEGGHGA